MTDQFVHLHNHSDMGSMLDGFGSLPEYLERVVELGQPGFGLSDHGTGQGIYTLIRMAKSMGITPVAGCLLAGQEIITENGVKPIEDIKIGDYVLTHKGRFRKVLRLMKREYEGVAYEVELNNRYNRKLTLTEEHPILIRDDKGDITWKKPGEIEFKKTKKSGGVDTWKSWVCVPKLQEKEKLQEILFTEFLPKNENWQDDDGRIVKIQEGRQNNKWNLPAELSLDEDLSYLLGIYAAEGSLRFNRKRNVINGKINFDHHINEIWIAEKIQNIVKKFGINAKIISRPEENRNNSISTEMSNLPLAHFLNHFVGRGAKNKRIPKIIFESPKNIRDAFLRGAMDGDGTTSTLKSNPAKHENYKTISPHLAWGMRTLLADSGYFSCVKSTPAYTNTGINAQESFIVNSNPHRKYSRTLEDKNYVFKPIKNIEKLKIKNTVYNFEVEEDNSYVSDFVLHNCEFYLAPQNPEGAKAKYPVFYGKDGQKNLDFDVSSNGAYTHQTIWAVNNTGLHNLFKLLTMSNSPEHFYSKPRIDFDMLAEHSDGLVAATGCPSSEISTRFLMGQEKEAYAYANRLKEVFGDRLFVEIMEHDMSINLERKLLPKLMGLSQKLDIPLLATNDAHYTRAGDNIHHDEMLCTQSHSRMTDATYDEGGSRFAFNGDQYYLKTAADMEKVFPRKDFPGALSNTLLIAEMAQDVDMTYNPSLRPHAIIPKEHNGEVEYFQHLIETGFKERYKEATPEIKKEARARIKTEFDIIHSSNFVGYFLTVYEYMSWTRNKYSVYDEAGDMLALSVGVGRGCFLPDTEVWVNKCWKKIQEVSLNDGNGNWSKALTHEGTHQNIEKVFQYTSKNEDCTEITLANGKSFKCTSDHNIFMKEVGFVEAGTLNVGDILLGSTKAGSQEPLESKTITYDFHNEIKIVSTRNFKYSGPVYDMQIENVHNYNVAGVTVHNSVGGSIIAYLLYISELDPIKHDLLFERFLSAGRGDTYEIQYDDGTTEEIIVSGEKTLVGGTSDNQKKYIHQLNVGDTVAIDPNVDIKVESNNDLTPELIEEPKPKTSAPKKRIEMKRKSKTLDLGNVGAQIFFDPDTLTDLTKIPF